jgi:transcription initiation factor TFIIIB Brf1 subunit/transcription initiation factor TFIIB
MGPILRCESHPNSVLIEDHRAGDMICSMCGLVVGDRIVDVSSEWRTFANDTESKDMYEFELKRKPFILFIIVFKILGVVSEPLRIQH